MFCAIDNARLFARYVTAHVPSRQIHGILLLYSAAYVVFFACFILRSMHLDCLTLTSVDIPHTFILHTSLYVSFPKKNFVLLLSFFTLAIFARSILYTKPCINLFQSFLNPLLSLSLFLPFSHTCVRADGTRTINNLPHFIMLPLVRLCTSISLLRTIHTSDDQLPPPLYLRSSICTLHISIFV